MKVSVVVPVYNEERYLGRCLDALSNQTQKPDEIIVVDNNSTDNSVKIAKKYPVRIIKEKEQGISYARNAGFDAAKYPIIARADADVEVMPNWIERIKKDFANENIDAVAGTVYFPDSFGVWGNNLVLDLIKLAQKGQKTMFGLNMAISKKAWEKIRTYVNMDNKKVHEDMDLALWLNKANGKIVYDKKFIVKRSSRRIFNNPLSFFIEYPLRAVATITLPRVIPKKIQ
jgi:glycosyltransferase involved in cell wall biosynthesis